MGDYVYLKLHPYQQISVEGRKNRKLSPKFYGPYKIFKKLGKVAYTLELPPGSAIHPTFHVSLLKKSVGTKELVSSVLPALLKGDKQELKPKAVLDRAIFKKGTKAGVKWLIEWEGRDTDETT